MLASPAALAAALRTSIAVARRDLGGADAQATRAVALAPDAAAPRLALSYARQLALDLDGAVAAAAEPQRGRRTRRCRRRGWRSSI